MDNIESPNGVKKPETGVPRRKLLGWIVGAVNVGVIAAAVGPAVAFILAPLRRPKEPGKWVPVVDDTELPAGETRSFTYALDVDDGYMVSNRRYSVFLARKGSRVVAYDPTCPHLGCHVEYKSRKKRFVCPCHGGVFDDEGQRVSGPPPKGLTKLAAKVENGKIWVYKA